MYKTFGSYDYSQTRSHTFSANRTLLYLDYNEYYGNIHPDTFQVFKNATNILTSYFRPGDHSLENLLADAFGATDLNFHLVSGADHALEEILGFCGNQLNLKTFHSFHQTTYDHFYTFTQKLGFECSAIDKAELIYVCCPNNPDGKILTATDCLKLVNLYSNKYFIFDLSYLAYSNETYASYFRLLKNFPNAFFLSSLAKIFPIAGLRAGWFSTTKKSANQYFDKYLNAKMVNPISRKVLESCLERIDFYREQTKEIFSNREKLAKCIVNFLESKKINTRPKYEIAASGGNFFCLEFENKDQIHSAIRLLEEAQIYIRYKSHWDFIRVTSINDYWMKDIKERLK